MQNGKGRTDFVTGGGIIAGEENAGVYPFTMQKDSYIKNAGPTSLKELIITMVSWFGTTAYDQAEIRNGEVLDKKFDKYRYIGEWFNIHKNDAIDYIKNNLCYYTDKDVVEFNDIIQSDDLCQEECKPINDENFISKKVNDKYIIGDEILLDRPLSTFKRIGKGMYEDKNKYIFSIKYENRQWIMKRIR